MNKYSTVAIANAIIQNIKESSGVSPDQQKVQKLMVIFHGINIALKGSSPFRDAPMVCPNGPIFESFYNAAKKFRMAPLPYFTLTLCNESGHQTSRVVVPQKSDAEFWSLFEEFMQKYSSHTGLELAEMCSKPESPWHTARGFRYTHIPDHLFAEYFGRSIDFQSSSLLYDFLD